MIVPDSDGDLDRAADHVFGDLLEVPLEVGVNPVCGELGASLDFQFILAQVEPGLAEPHGMSALAETLAEQVGDGVGGRRDLRRHVRLGKAADDLRSSPGTA